ncbi:MAG TPA: ATP-dependent sacrificial sulfur transferase LarE, partial [Longimicrobium sp.]|nr:ATP-dependent sacrificial sulfur transferase LarE [Longimicrobium sp.]
ELWTRLSSVAREHGLTTVSQEKRQRLAAILRECESVVVGYSGGVDSVFLARVAVDVLGTGRVLAVTGKSDSVASWMEDTAREVARDFGIPWLEVETREMDDPRYAANPSNRCYFCKSELWTRLSSVAREHGLKTVLDGSNADDVGDHRPGAVAATENAVRSPLLEAGLTKAEIRAWSHELGLPTWDQPAAPCLASRLPYGIAVTPERLRQVEQAELALRALGFRDFRVRHHGDVARLEVHPSEIGRVPGHRAAIHAAVLEAGFRRVLVDLQGYRRGALNEGLMTTQLVQLGAAA